jgi:hypothetical protein
MSAIGTASIFFRDGGTMQPESTEFLVGLRMVDRPGSLSEKTRSRDFRIAS